MAGDRWRATYKIAGHKWRAINIRPGHTCFRKTRGPSQTLVTIYTGQKMAGYEWRAVTASQTSM
jgi:hypothetical protein